MGREGKKPPAGLPGVTLITPRPGAYQATQSLAGATYKVDTGPRQFLVVVAFSRTLVFERIARPDVYVQRRDIGFEMDPIGAVSGYTLSPVQSFDPMTDLQQRLDASEKARWAYHNEIVKLRESLRRSEKERGKRGSRNS